MNVKNLLIKIALIFCLSVSAASAADPYITATADINPDKFWSQDSEQSPSKGTVTITLTGSGDPVALPIEAVLAIDSSGSMSENDPNGDRLAAAESFVNTMNPGDDKIGLVSWDDNVDVQISPKSNFEEVAAGIYDVDSDGGTNLDAGLNSAIDIMSNGGGALKTIVFLSDGNGNYTPSGVSGSPADRAKKMEIVIYTIGLNVNGTAVESNLKDIATTTGGKYYDAPDSSSLKSFYEEISKAVTEIAGRDVVVGYAVPKNTIIDNYRTKPSETEEGNAKVLTWNVGTISIGETWKTSFDVSFKSGGAYTLGAVPYSKVDYSRYDGTSGNQEILGSEVVVSEPGTFALTGKGFGNSVEDPATRVTVIKDIIPNAQGTCPDINLTVQMPGEPYYINAVFALDTSPSMIYVKSDKEHIYLEDGMVQAVESLMRDFNGVNVSIVSWDEGDPDFVTPLTPVINGNDVWILDALDDLDSTDEMDHTVYADGLRPAIDVLDQQQPKTDSYVTRNIIVFVTGESEFSPGTDWGTQIARARDGNKGYIVYTVGLEIDEDKTPMQYSYLTNACKDTGGKFYSIDDISGIAGVVKDIKEDLLNLPVAENVIVTDTLYPYLVVGDVRADVDVTKGAIRKFNEPTNSDSSTTLVWSLGEMKGGKSETLTIHPSLMISIPAEVNGDSRKKEIYRIDETTPNSKIEYNWLVGSSKGPRSMELPEGEIRITCGMPPEKPSARTAPVVEPETAPLGAEVPAAEESSKTPGFEAVISIGGILAAVYAFRRR